MSEERWEEDNYTVQKVVGQPNRRLYFDFYL